MLKAPLLEQASGLRQELDAIEMQTEAVRNTDALRLEQHPIIPVTITFDGALPNKNEAYTKLRDRLYPALEDRGRFNTNTASRLATLLVSGYWYDSEKIQWHRGKGISFVSDTISLQEIREATDLKMGITLASALLTIVQHDLRPTIDLVHTPEA